MLILSQIKILFQNKLTPPSSPLFQTSLILTKAFSQNWKNTSFPLKVLKFLPFSLNWFVLSPSFSFFPSSFSPFSLSYFPPFLPLLPSSPFFLSSSLFLLAFSFSLPSFLLPFFSLPPSPSFLSPPASPFFLFYFPPLHSLLCPSPFPRLAPTPSTSSTATSTPSASSTSTSTAPTSSTSTPTPSTSLPLLSLLLYFILPSISLYYCSLHCINKPDLLFSTPFPFPLSFSSSPFSSSPSPFCE